MVCYGTIDKETMAVLLPNKLRMPWFYILPKIHKPENPGRPMVSSCRSPTKGISQFVDFHLGPLVRKIPSYMSDTTDFLLKLQNNGSVPPDTLLVTLDVNLYK